LNRGLLDTSVVIALARGEAVELPDTAAISIITLCGLHHGVLVADDRQRPGRLAALTTAERRFRPLPLDERVPQHYGRIVADARRAGRRPGMADSLIAATAAANGLPVYTRDKDFLGLSGIEVVPT
jgi:predicted nucleic acid-binding protein